MQVIDITEEAKAKPETVHALLRDGAVWPTCSSLGSFELESEGETERGGVGAVRIFRTGRYTMRERIVESVPGSRFSYELLSGLALRGYRAEIDLTPLDTGTRIHWRSTFRPKVPGTGWLYRRTLHRLIKGLVHGLATTAAARAAQ
ncbi:SRPBCC family protein [Amycolatopsis taiwanensis]|uniref:MxaD family protein n=1 Tax=Amycolatopsis taiwanensis TaxID=342230 RepID=A0A9W6R1N6_9PSEU|nr:SRPBCC family protein [Amycolatopsis taiwanensis]GLY65952.1 MxaD family protein [Amycolatopsis taiwanensis]